MVYKIAGGIGLALLGASLAGHPLVSGVVTGLFLIVAGVALLAGV